jgi:uncharacterized membrane protein
MQDLLLKYITVYFSSMLRFIAGPIAGLSVGLSLLETVLFTAMGMMTTVLILTLLGKPARAYLQNTLWKNKKRFTPRNRRFVKIWNRWGVFGVSFLTPLLLSPIVGGMLVNLFGGAKKEIITYMLASAVFWGFVMSGILFSAKDLVL